MPRKRVAEEDLLKYRQLAEAHARTLGEKYAELDKKHAPPIEPVREKGVLILAQPAAPDEFIEAIRRGGIAVTHVDIEGYVEKDRFDRTPAWERRLIQAQDGLTKLRERCDIGYVVGIGSAAALATVIAEQYPVEGLFIVGGGLRSHRPFGAGARLARLARQNLFSVICPVSAVMLEDGGEYSAASLTLYRTDTRSPDVKLSKLQGARESNLWSDYTDEIIAALTEFLRA